MKEGREQECPSLRTSGVSSRHSISTDLFRLANDVAGEFIGNISQVVESQVKGEEEG